jgi:hypothetical protein
MLIPKSNNEQIACISCSVFSGFGILDIAYDDDTGDQTHQGNGDHARLSGAGQIRDCNFSPAQLKNSLTKKTSLISGAYVSLDGDVTLTNHRLGLKTNRIYYIE